MNVREFARPAALLFLLLLPYNLLADTFVGTAVKTVDGDTVHVLDAEKTLHKVRLAGIDPPERGQPFGAKSKRYLLELVGGIAETDGTDRPDWSAPVFRYTSKVSRQVLRFFKHCFHKRASRRFMTASYGPCCWRTYERSGHRCNGIKLD